MLGFAQLPLEPQMLSYNFFHLRRNALQDLQTDFVVYQEALEFLLLDGWIKALREMQISSSNSFTIPTL